MSEVATPSYQKNSSDRIKEALALLPARPMRPGVQSYTQFRVLDNLRGTFLAVEYCHEPYIDKPSQGIATFDRDFHSGVILPDGNVLIAHYEWRAAMMEYHGGWYITVLDGSVRQRPESEVSPLLWGSILAKIQDDRIRSEMVSRAVAQGVAKGETYIDLLQAAHAVHRDDVLRKPHFNEPSLVCLTI